MDHLVVTPNQLRQILKTARKASQLSQGELAARVGLSQSRISAFEQDTANIGLGQLLALLNALDLDLLVKPRNDTSPAAVSPSSEW